MGSLGGAVRRWWGCGGGGGGAGLAASCCVSCLGQDGDMPVVATTVHEGVAGAVPAVVDVPVYAATWRFAHSEGASDSVHRAV